LATILILLILLSGMSFTGVLSDNDSKIIEKIDADAPKPVAPKTATPAPATPAPAAPAAPAQN
jgi:preprotein translocase subunit SecG